MAKSKHQEYDGRKNNFGHALDEIILYSSNTKNEDCRKYCERLSEYFEQNQGTDADKKSNYHILAENLKKKEISEADISAIFGVSQSTVNRWRVGALPPLEIPLKLSEIFDVTTDFMVGRTSIPNRESESEFAVFKKYGIEDDAFLNLKRFHDRLEKEKDSPTRDASKYETETIRYGRIVAALNLLLKQSARDDSEEDMQILMDIGYLLESNHFENYYCFDSDDVDNLMSALFESLDTDTTKPEDVKQTIQSFIDDCPQYSPVSAAIGELDTIRNELKDYKEQLSPGFFKSKDYRTYRETDASVTE